MITVELRRALFNRGVEIVVLLGGYDDAIPSYSAYELFFDTSDFKSSIHRCYPAALSDSFLEEYARCVSRIGFNPLTGANSFCGGGIVNPDNLMDWAQLHASMAGRLLELYKPDQIWMANNPHMGFDNALVEVADARDVKVLQCAPVPIPGKFHFKRPGQNEDNGWESRPVFEKLDLSDFSPNLFYMRTVRRDDEESTLTKWGRVARVSFRQNSIRSFLAGAYDFSIRHHMALVPSILELADAHQRSSALFRFQRRISAKRLRKRVPRIKDWKALDEPFIYFPLHYEPEAAVSVVKSGFHNQANAIQALRASVPTNWVILLKENPKQGYLHRDRAFYARIKAMDNVAFVADSVESQSLIDESEFVATVTGTAGFEAIRSGKACVYFGQPWYATLPGAVCFSRNLAFESLSKETISREAINRALSKLSETLADGIMNHWMIKTLPEHRSVKELTETTAASLVTIARALDAEDCR